MKLPTPARSRLGRPNGLQGRVRSLYRATRAVLPAVLLATLGGLAGSGHVAFAQLWTVWAPGGPPAPSVFNTWQAVAVSADGTRLAAGGGFYDYVCNTCSYPPWGENALYVSTNSGATWISGPIDLWQSIAASADWTKLVAASQLGYFSGSGQIYTSTNSGVTWTANTNLAANIWSSVASSADGSRLVAVASLLGNGSIYVSTDSGSTWSQA